jgi:predicted peptidase
VSAAVVLSVLLLGLPPTHNPPALKDVFGTGEYRYTGGQYNGGAFPYRLFVPRNQVPGRRYPLLVWLHGVGECGSNNESSLRWLDLVLADREHLEKYPFFILVLQCPKANPYWFKRGAGGERGTANDENAGAVRDAADGHDASAEGDAADDMISVVFNLLEKTMQEYAVDPDRVCLSGVSSGGTGCWEMAMRHPEVFSAVVPLSSAGGDNARAATLTGIPIWAVHNDADTNTPPDGVRATVAAVNAAGGNAHLSLLASKTHNTWTAAFRELGVMEWMLAQRRGSTCWPPPGCKPWAWWSILTVPAAFAAVVLIGRRSELRRRTRRSAGDKNDPQHGDR